MFIEYYKFYIWVLLSTKNKSKFSDLRLFYFFPLLQEKSIDISLLAFVLQYLFFLMFWFISFFSQSCKKNSTRNISNHNWRIVSCLYYDISFRLGFLLAREKKNPFALRSFWIKNFLFSIIFLFISTIKKHVIIKIE